MTKKLKWKRVYIIDDQETYSQGLADGVQKILSGRGVKVTRDSISQQDSDFSSKIAKIPSNTQVIYIPWQLAPQAQAFGQQLKAAGKGNIKLFGSDGLFAPGVWKIAGSYDSSFPYNPTDPVVKAYIKAHDGNGEFFGLPSLRGGPGRRRRDHEGLRGRQGDPCRGAQADREDEPRRPRSSASRSRS